MPLWNRIGSCYTDARGKKTGSASGVMQTLFFRLSLYIFSCAVHDYVFFSLSVLRVVDVRKIRTSQQRSGIFLLLSADMSRWFFFWAVMFTECRTQIFLHFCHFMFNFKRNMWSRIGRYVSSWHVMCTWKCVLNTNSVASNPINFIPSNKAVCREGSPQIKGPLLKYTETLCRNYS